MSLKIGKHCTHVYTKPVSFTGWSYSTEEIDVILMAVAKGYAMVRRPRCMPYVVEIKDLK